jgi:hypothetical protein
MFVALLKRITGTDERALAQERRLHRNLNGMAKKNEELDRLAEHVDRVIEKVTNQSQRQRSAMPSGTSGEHQLNLPPIPSPPKEVSVHVRERRPDSSEKPNGG